MEIEKGNNRYIWDTVKLYIVSHGWKPFITTETLWTDKTSCWKQMPGFSVPHIFSQIDLMWQQLSGGLARTMLGKNGGEEGERRKEKERSQGGFTIQLLHCVFWRGLSCLSWTFLTVAGLWWKDVVQFDPANGRTFSLLCFQLLTDKKASHSCF